MNFKEYLSNFKEVVDREVEGWFYPKDIIITYGILNEIQKSSGDICEIGVAYGKSAIMISQFKICLDKMFVTSLEILIQNSFPD